MLQVPMHGTAIFPLCERLRALIPHVSWRIDAYQMLCCAEIRPTCLVAERPAGICLK
jgi:hypothetical protein